MNFLAIHVSTVVKEDVIIDADINITSQVPLLERSPIIAVHDIAIELPAIRIALALDNQCRIICRYVSNKVITYLSVSLTGISITTFKADASICPGTINRVILDDVPILDLCRLANDFLTENDKGPTSSDNQNGYGTDQFR